MKKILITGANSFIGTSFERYIERNFKNEYVIDTIDMISGSWRKKDFSLYDSVFHVAGIAHSERGKISAEREQLYYNVNARLAIETAEKAKKEGVKQFIFMSSAIVYGDSAPIGKTKVITKETPLNPKNCYGKSKVMAEEGLITLNSNSFKVVILRPPMIYGANCKGNYPLLAEIAHFAPIFPYIKNDRSMLYIENLCEFVRLMVKNDENGIFWPQNNEYSNTSELVKMIAETQGKKIILVKGFEWALKFIGLFTGIINKAFGSLSYEKSISEYKERYSNISLAESITRTEANR